MRFWNKLISAMPSIQVRKIGMDDSFSGMLPLQRQLNKAGLFKDLTIFDVGAYKGKVSLDLLKCFPTSKIFAFEPVSASFASLEKISVVNPSVIPFRYALGAEAKPGCIYLNKFDETNSLLPSAKTGSFVDGLTSIVSREEIQIKTLDEVAKDLFVEKIDFLKIDVQGLELDVLKGAVGFLSTHRITCIYCEVEFIEIYQGQPLVEDIIQFLRGFNYRPVWLANINYINDEQIAWADLLFIKNEDNS